jgi:hypothetical protein
MARRYRLAQLLIGLLAICTVAFGAFMLAQPLLWYRAVPTVVFTGPFNQHFVRDIGAAYLACGLLFGWAMLDLGARRLAVLAGALWLSLHALVHLYEVTTGICGVAIFWRDFPGVFGPPALALLGSWLARR